MASFTSAVGEEADHEKQSPDVTLTHDHGHVNDKFLLLPFAMMLFHDSFHEVRVKRAPLFMAFNIIS